MPADPELLSFHTISCCCGFYYFGSHANRSGHLKRHPNLIFISIFSRLNFPQQHYLKKENKKNNKEINVSSRDMKRKRVLSSLVMGMLNLALIVVSFGPVIELGNVRFPVVWTEPVRWPVPVASLSCHAR